MKTKERNPSDTPLTVINGSKGEGSEGRTGENDSSVDQLRREVQETARTSKELLQELSELKAALHAQKHEGDEGGRGQQREELEQTARDLEQANKALRERVAERDALEKKIQELLLGNQELERKVSALEKQRTNAPEEQAGGAKASFRIDIYSREGNGGYAGKIVQLGIPERSPFRISGVDKEAIADFIAARLPQKELHAAAEPENKAPATPIAPYHAPSESIALTVYAAGSPKPTHIVDHAHPFQACIAIHNGEHHEPEETLPCRVSLHAELLGKGRPSFLCERSGSIARAHGTFIVAVPAGSLTTGDYRLTAVIKLGSRDAKEYPESVHQASKLITVY